ncbi:biosynthetic arginine decarboxylase [Ectothiorhodospiraceae bacterium WFHF3C12]|nr:biosynthetic arginine decarboxylase [Ectothiorhodospiraceae bacterium WFHF3C12]
MSRPGADKARLTYNVAHWSSGYFDVSNGGRLMARASRLDGAASADIYEIAREAQASGLKLPLLIRFLDVLRDRVAHLGSAFTEAMERDAYQGRYTAVYPIKVNQQRRVVEEIVAAAPGRVGLEAGSKPELMAVLAMVPDGGTVICNGYKDRGYIRLALLARQLGLDCWIVVEKLTELDLVLEESRRLGIPARLGVRVRLSSIGEGKWQNTGGEKSKFGLTAAQVLDVVERLRAAGTLDSLGLLHFHLGSQIPNIGDIRRGLREATRYYAELRRLGAPVECVDVGGGLGVDYEGTRSRSFCSMNYSLAEYAQAVVHTLWEGCAQEGLPHPDIVTECGRAMTAHHAVLVTNVIDVDRVPDGSDLSAPGDDDPMVLHDLWSALHPDPARSPLEAWHDASHYLGEAQTMYTHGLLSLEQRARAERVYHAACQAVRRCLDPTVRAHRAVLDDLNERLADKMFGNFSLFQSLPDIWAIDQIFPILPLHRLDEPPESRNVLQDLTCDSDGAIHLYVDREGIESTLPLPQYRQGEPYLLGIFLVGAYQEILGDMHNLFGDTDSVNVTLDDSGFRLTGPARGDTVASVLEYVHFRRDELLGAYERRVARAPLDEEQRRQCLTELQAGLDAYTYLT